MTQLDWSERLALSVASRVRERRESLGMSGQDLARECTDLGWPIRRSVIANFENGRRLSIGFAEILVFSAALGVSPMFLMCPVGKESEFEALPHVTVDPYVAALWISGDRAELDEQGESVEANNPLRVGPSLIRAVDNLARMKRQAEAKARIVARLEEEAKRVSSEEDYEQAFHNAELKLAEAEKADNLAQRERLVREAQVFADIALVQSKARMTALKLDRNIADERASLSRLKTSLEVRENYLKSQFRELVASGYIPPRLSPEMQYLLGELDASEGKNEFED